MSETRAFDETGVLRGADGIARYDGLPRSLVQMLRATVEDAPDREALVETGGGPRLTYAQLWEGAARVAGGLRAAGIEPGDRVAIRLGNGVGWALAFFGGQLAGAIVVPVNTRLSADEVRYVIDDSGASYVIDAESPAESPAGPPTGPPAGSPDGPSDGPPAGLPDGPPAGLPDGPPAGLPDGPPAGLPGGLPDGLPDGPPYIHEAAGPDDPAAIFYTSGTTGFPKGAITTHANFMSNCETCRRVIGMPAAEPLRTLVSVPLFHVTGCNSQLLVACYQGGTTVIMPAFEVGPFLRAIEDERIDVLTTVPAIYWLAINSPGFAETDVSSVRFLSYGGAPIAPELVGRIKKAFPDARVGNGFGLTETSSVTTYLPHEYAAEHADSVGFAAPVCDLRIDPIDEGEDAGELLVRGPNVVAGYWNKPEATAATFEDGWLSTGDIARIDAEGLVHIVDRAKDMINRGGENVYCVEVENALAGAPGVFEAAVVGVPDEVMGEKVGAILVPMPGGALDVPAVIDHLSGRLADFKVPQYVSVRADPLPRNPGGKIIKRRLRDETTWPDPLR